CIAFRGVDGRISGSIYDNVGLQCVYSAGQLFWLLKIRALYVVSSKRNYFAQRREAALKLPTELATFPEKQKSHDDPVYMLTSREEFSCPTLLGRSVTSV